MKITSSIFKNNNDIPTKYTCDGSEINPSLVFSEIPKNTKSLILIVDDPDAPMGTFVHWVVFNIDPAITLINEDFVPGGAIEGKNSAGSNKYVGPCPPSGTHRYFFKVYALDIKLNLDNSADKKQIEDNIKNHVLGSAEIIGLYSRNK